MLARAAVPNGSWPHSTHLDPETFAAASDSGQLAALEIGFAEPDPGQHRLHQPDVHRMPAWEAQARRARERPQPGAVLL